MLNDAFLSGLLKLEDFWLVFSRSVNSSVVESATLANSEFRFSDSVCFDFHLRPDEPDGSQRSGTLVLPLTEGTPMGV